MSRVTSLRLSDSEYDALQTLASETGRSIRECVAEAINAQIVKGKGAKARITDAGYAQGVRDGMRAVFTAYREVGSDLYERILKKLEKKA